jgi:HPt (histidine-containing phosphotransfer) domain-containing protein
MVNWDRISELRDEIGAEDYAEVVGLFFAEVDTAIARLSLPGTLKERESDLHFLKGSALNLGFDALGGLCAESEQRAAEGILEEAEVVSVIEAYHASRTAFEAGQPAAA